MDQREAVVFAFIRLELICLDLIAWVIFKTSLFYLISISLCVCECISHPYGCLWIPKEGL